MKFSGWWLPLVAALALPGTLAAQEDDCPCRARPGMIGVIFDGGERAEGVRVVEVRRGSPAERAGVRAGDVVVRLNGEDAASGMDALPRRLQAGDTVRLRVRGDGGERDVVVVAEARPGTQFSFVRPGGDGAATIVVDGDSMALPLRMLTRRIDSLSTRIVDLSGGRFRVEVDSAMRLLNDSAGVWMRRLPNMEFYVREPGDEPGNMLVGPGVVLRGRDMMEGRDALGQLPFVRELGRRSAAGAELAEMNEGLSRYFGGRREGALVIDVAPDSPAARAGLEPGDVIVRAGAEPVRNPADLREALNRAAEARLSLEVIRQGRRRELSLEWTRPDARELRPTPRAAPRGRQPR